MRALLAAVRPPHPGAADRRRRRRRSRRRGRPAGAGRRPGAGGHGVPALPRERRVRGRTRTRWPTRRSTRTAVTRAFSGRRARALVNAMMRDHQDAPAAYPEINNATRPLRAAAAAAGRRRAHEPVRRHRLPPRPRRGRRPRSWSGWCRDWRAVSEPAVRRRRLSSRRPTSAAWPTRWRSCVRPASGWINLLPGVDEDASDLDPPAGLFALLRQPSAAGDDGDLMPARDRREPEG